MHRRRFLQQLAAGGCCLALGGRRQVPDERELAADVLIIGGGIGGCAAALAAARSGLRVILTEETGWIGGQLTQQGVPPDEHPWIEQFGATRSYRVFRRAVRAYYRAWYPLAAEAQADPSLNPGTCWVSTLCHEPRVALAVLESMLAPYRAAGHLHLLLEHRPVRAEVDGDRVRAVTVRDEQTGIERVLVAPFVLDATEQGDLLPMTGTAYVTGSEAQAVTGEPHASAEARPANVQAPTWCFALSYEPGADHTIEPPPDYEAWRTYVPRLTPPWPGPLLSLTYTHPITLEPTTQPFDPRPGADQPGLWAYRRLADPAQFREGTYPGGTSLINWPQNDYLAGNLVEVDQDEADRHSRAAQQLSLSLCSWLQTEVPRPDGGTGWPGLRLRGDLMGTDHGLAKRPYIREARRIQAVFTVTEMHVGLEARQSVTGEPEGDVTAAPFDDSVGIGSYRIDLHPTTGGDNYLDIPSLPFQIPLGALLPQRMTNLLPAAKNIGTTHITNGCYRLHPVEWNIGEAAGLLAAFCRTRGRRPHEVRADATQLADFQRILMHDGIELAWPDPRHTPR